VDVEGCGVGGRGGGVAGVRGGSEFNIPTNVMLCRNFVTSCFVFIHQWTRGTLLRQLPTHSLHILYIIVHDHITALWYIRYVFEKVLFRNKSEDFSFLFLG